MFAQHRRCRRRRHHHHHHHHHQHHDQHFWFRGTHSSCKFNGLLVSVLDKAEFLASQDHSFSRIVASQVLFPRGIARPYTSIVPSCSIHHPRISMMPSTFRCFPLPRSLMKDATRSGSRNLEKQSLDHPPKSRFLGSQTCQI